MHAEHRSVHRQSGASRLQALTVWKASVAPHRPWRASRRTSASPSAAGRIKARLGASIETASKVVAISAAIVGGAATLYQIASKAHEERVAQSIKFFQALRANPSHAAVTARLIESQAEGLRLAAAATNAEGLARYVEFSKKLAYGANEAQFWELLEQYQITAVCVRERLCDCRSLVAFTGEEARRTRIWLTSAIDEKRAARKEPSVASGLDYIVEQYASGCAKHAGTYQSINAFLSR